MTLKCHFKLYSLTTYSGTLLLSQIQQSLGITFEVIQLENLQTAERERAVTAQL